MFINTLILSFLVANQGFALDGTVLQLTRLVYSLAEGLENKSVIANCYFDLSKAFDRVWHEGLLAKLAHVGISGALLAWFEGYRKGRF